MVESDRPSAARGMIGEESMPPERCHACGASATYDAVFCEACGARLAAAPARLPSQPQPGGYADFWTRLAAYIVDWVIVWFGLVFIVGVLSGAGFATGAVIVLFAPHAYFWIGNSLGGTAGKRITGLAVIDEAGNPPGLARGLVRYLVSLGSALALYIGYLWVIWDGKKQTWHDKAAGTYVVHRAHRPAIAS